MIQNLLSDLSWVDEWRVQFCAEPNDDGKRQRLKFFLNNNSRRDLKLDLSSSLSAVYCRLLIEYVVDTIYMMLC